METLLLKELKSNGINISLDTYLKDNINYLNLDLIDGINLRDISKILKRCLPNNFKYFRDTNEFYIDEETDNKFIID